MTVILIIQIPIHKFKVTKGCYVFQIQPWDSHYMLVFWQPSCMHYFVEKYSNLEKLEVGVKK